MTTSKTIKMHINGDVFWFQVIYLCKEYIFAECPDKPEFRGFFTAKFVEANIVMK